MPERCALSATCLAFLSSLTDNQLLPVLLEVDPHIVHNPGIQNANRKTRNANQLEGHCALYNPLQISEVPLSVPVSKYA